MNNQLETALSDMYTEVIIFCARAITFFRNNPSFDKSRSAWSYFTNDFHKTIAKLKEHSRRVDEEADLIRMAREGRSAETVSVIESLQRMRVSENVNLPCRMIPYGLNPRFFNRMPELELIRNVLNPKEGNDRMRVMAIHGLGGVGKTQLALHYANTSFKSFEAIIWLPSESPLKLNQALSQLANKLGLPKSDNEDDHQASMKVRDWLNATDIYFLLIFDNVDDINTILQIWPSSEKGSILITTRSPSVASKRATETFHVEPFNITGSPKVLYKLTGSHPIDEMIAELLRRYVEC